MVKIILLMFKLSAKKTFNLIVKLKLFIEKSLFGGYNSFIVDGKEVDNNQAFTEVSISEFYDKEDNSSEQQNEGIVILTAKEEELYNQLLPLLEEAAPDRAFAIKQRMKDLHKLIASIARFPSLLERSDLPGGIRTPELLIDSLIKHQDKGDTTLQLPSKAMLGKAFMVSKIHTFSSLTKLSIMVQAPVELTKALQLETITIMFSLMAEDVYLNLLRDTTQPMDFRRSWALSLLLIWEHRNDQTVESIAPVLQSVWEARRKLAPAFGTMMGTSELIMMSMQMDEQWIHFIQAKLEDPEVKQAMEEFLFGISFEQIEFLKGKLREQGISAINRDEVSSFLQEHVKADAGLDYRDFYSLYTIRRDNARARERMKLPGPHKTLEDHFIQYVTVQNKEKQSKDVFAK